MAAWTGLSIGRKFISFALLECLIGKCHVGTTLRRPEPVDICLKDIFGERLLPLHMCADFLSL
jgi:hypothetical protein